MNLYLYNLKVFYDNLDKEDNICGFQKYSGTIITYNLNFPDNNINKTELTQDNIIVFINPLIKYIYYIINFLLNKLQDTMKKKKSNTKNNIRE